MIYFFSNDTMVEWFLSFDPCPPRQAIQWLAKNCFHNPVASAFSECLMAMFEPKPKLKARYRTQQPTFETIVRWARYTIPWAVWASNEAYCKP